MHQIFLFERVHGYDPSNLLTIGLVVGMLKAAHSFGAMLGPTLSGVLTQEIGFEWTCTIISGPHLLFVGQTFGKNANPTLGAQPYVFELLWLISAI